MIPKKIHYCWFWNNKKSKAIEKCLKSWKEICSEFEIIEWNESNFDINICNFTKQAYKQKMWAYVADYARFYILEKEWWVYLDTDMLLFKNISPLLNNNFFLWFQDFYGEDDSIRINWWIIWMKKNNLIWKQFLNYYHNITDKNIIVDRKFVIPSVIKKVLKPYNIQNKDIVQKIKDNIIIYPIEYFYIANQNKKSSNSYAIHLWEGSWLSKNEKIKKYIYNYCLSILHVLNLENIIKKIFRKIKWNKIK